MDRPSLRYKIPLLLLASLLSVMVAGGCMSGLAGVMYLIKGTDVEPEYKHLKGKRVAVVVHCGADLGFRNSRVPAELAEQIGFHLQKNVPKIKVIDQQKVGEWCDENNPDEINELGKALKADMVVSVELGSFSLLQSQTIYQGRAVSSVQVYDCRTAEQKAKDKATPKKDKDADGNIVFEKTLPETKYPPIAGGVPTSEKQESEFRQEFIKILADQIGRHFYAHDRHADFAQDVSTL
jgi:hypothetical protein